MGIDESRRRVLEQGGAALLAAMVAGAAPRTWAQQPKPQPPAGPKGLEVASAGAARAMLEGPLQAAALGQLKLDLHTHAESADTVAHALVAGSLHADVFLPITASPMLTVMRAGGATEAQPVARTELVLVYSPRGRFAQLLPRAARLGTPWYKTVAEPGLRIGRGDPSADPGARAILWALMLAEQKYAQPGLAQAVLGDPMNPAQLVPDVQAKLESGDLDLSGSYKTAALTSGLPYLELDPEINLSRDDVQTAHPGVQLTIAGQTYAPEPLVFYAAALRQAANRAGAAAFVTWLQGAEAQKIFSEHGFLPTGEARPLTL